MTDHVSHIRAIYMSGTPLFTREAIQQISQQLIDVRPGGRIFVKGLDGKLVAFRSREGELARSYESGIVAIWSKPEVQYRTFEQLVANHACSRLSYCSVTLIDHAEYWDNSTGILLDENDDPDLDLLEEYFKTVRQTWDFSKSCRKLITSLKTIKKDAKLNITKIVAFGLSSISWRFEERHEDDQSLRASYQHSLLLTIRETLMATSSQGVECYSQDPMYTETDKNLLEDFGVKILDDPDGFAEIDDSAVVVSIYARAPVKQITADIARPALIITQEIDESSPPDFFPSKLSICADHDSPRVKTMIQQCYTRHRFPGPVEFFGKLGVYVRNF